MCLAHIVGTLLQYFASGLRLDGPCLVWHGLTKRVSVELQLVQPCVCVTVSLFASSVKIRGQSLWKWVLPSMLCCHLLRLFCDYILVNVFQANLLRAPPLSLLRPHPCPHTSNSSPFAVCSTAWTSHWLFLTSWGCSLMETRSFNALLLQNGPKEALVQCLYQGSFSSLRWGGKHKPAFKFRALAKAAVATTVKWLSASRGKKLCTVKVIRTSIEPTLQS